MDPGSAPSAIEIVGLAVNALFAWLGAIAVAVASALGSALALAQRSRRRGSVVNVALAALAVAASAAWGAVLLVGPGGTARDAGIVAPVALALLATATWLTLASQARTRREGAEGRRGADRVERG